MSDRRPLLLCTAFLILMSSPALARQELVQERFAFSPDVPMSEAVPSPAEFLGYELGTMVTLHADVVGYIKVLSESSDRITLHEYARTYEGRPLYYMVVTSPDNQARIEEIRRNNLMLADPDTPDEEAARLIAEQPVIPWLSYNVHGNEPSSTEAAMQVAYRLAAGSDQHTKDLLEQAVVIIDPAINPDGRDRFAYWYRSVQSEIPNPHTSDLEHSEPWPGGRTNHYWFDLNRDWVWLVHPESRGRLRAYQQWLPQMHTDYHEQGAGNNYFTMPGMAPHNLNLPDAYEDWADIYGQANAREFDRNQINYFTRESFDFFYPGYGSSYPSIMGAIGMLTEQGSSRGRVVETDDGYLLTFRQGIFDHYTTSMAGIETSVNHRAELLEYFRTFFMQSANRSDTRAYIIADDGGNGYAYDVIDTLLKHGVEVDRATSEFTVRDAQDYWTGQASQRSFDSGTFVIRTDQARHVLINTLMQRQMVIEDSVMYDMATWSIPLAYNLDAAWTRSDLRFDSESVTSAPLNDTGMDNPGAAYAYVIDWDQRHAPKALALLWEAGYRVRSARKTFTIDDTEYARGSLIILLGRNREKADAVRADMSRIAGAAGVRIAGFDSGRVQDGIDLASSNSRPVDKPRVAMLVDRPMSSYTAGQIWFLFDQWTGLSIDRVRVQNLSARLLTTYDVLIMPGGNVSSVIDSTMVGNLREWVSAGGTLIATESSATFFTKTRSKFTGVELVESDSDDDGKDEPKERYYTRYEARSDSSGLRRIPGSAMRGIIDDSHPLAFGIGDRLYSLKFSTDALEPGDNLQTVGYYDRDPEEVLASGYASKENREKIAGKTFAGVQPLGSGKVVFLLDNTQYRMFWIGPARMIQNAVMLLPGM